jgi:hypothetical protein
LTFSNVKKNVNQILIAELTIIMIAELAQNVGLMIIQQEHQTKELKTQTHVTHQSLMLDNSMSHGSHFKVNA